MNRLLFSISLLLGLAATSCLAIVFPPQTDHTLDKEIILGGYGPDNSTQFAGYINVGDHKNLFYWFFESRSRPEKDPLILWMTGGPGCSGLVALFYENGPYIINDDLSLKINPQSWTSFANVIWIDQPVGSGFSYSSIPLPINYVFNEAEIAQDVWEFLQIFLKNHPKYQSLPFFVTGESYAGHYIPAVSVKIVQQNQAGTGTKINIVGSAIGNGLVDPEIQYGYYAPFAYQHNIINKAVYDEMVATYPVCREAIRVCDNTTDPLAAIEACIYAVDICNLGQLLPVQATGVNVYDVRKKCTYKPLCYDFDNLPKFLEKPDVREFLGVGKHKWTECSTLVHLLLTGDWMKNYETDIPILLSAGVRVLVYAGEDDFICNYMGNAAWVKQMKWEGQNQYNSSPNTTFVVDGAVAGYSKNALGLTFLQVKDAGHMVPMDQPINALEMLRRFLNDLPFN